MSRYDIIYFINASLSRITSDSFHFAIMLQLEIFQLAGANEMAGLCALVSHHLITCTAHLSIELWKVRYINDSK